MSFTEIATLLAAGFALAGTVYTARTVARSGDRAAAKQAAVAEGANKVAARVAEVDGLDRLNKSLEYRLERVEKEAETCRDENRRLSERVDALEEQSHEDTRLINHLRTYVQTLRDYINETGPHARPVPKAPAGLGIN